MPIRTLTALALAMIFLTVPALGSVSCEAACSAAMATQDTAGNHAGAPAGGHDHHGGNASAVASQGKTPVALEASTCPAIQPAALQGHRAVRVTFRLVHAPSQLAVLQPALGIAVSRERFQPSSPPGTPAPSSSLTPALRI